MNDDRMRIDKWLWVARFFKTRRRGGASSLDTETRRTGGGVIPLQSADRGRR
jgi:hypothetical protein